MDNTSIINIKELNYNDIANSISSGDVIEFSLHNTGFSHYCIYLDKVFYENVKGEGVTKNTLENIINREKQKFRVPTRIFKYKLNNSELLNLHQRAEYLYSLGLEYDADNYNCADFIYDVFGSPNISANYNRKETFIRGLVLGAGIALAIKYITTSKATKWILTNKRSLSGIKRTAKRKDLSTMQKFKKSTRY